MIEGKTLGKGELVKEMAFKTEEGRKHIDVVKKYFAGVKGEKIDDKKAIKFIQKEFPKDAKVVTLSNVLVCCPDFDAVTYWSQWWIERCSADISEMWFFKCTRLYGNDFTKKNFFEILEKDKEITFISIVGHGNDDTLTCQNKEILIKVNEDELAEYFKGKIANFLSCSIGKRLVPYLISHGLVSAMAYNDIYYAVIDPASYPNKYFQYFARSHFTFDQKLYQGLTTYEAYKSVIAKYQNYIEDKDVPEGIKPYLYHDMTACNLYGDLTARISEIAMCEIVLIDEKGNENIVKKIKVPVNIEISELITIDTNPGKGKFCIRATLDDLKAENCVNVVYKKKERVLEVQIIKPVENEELWIGEDYETKFKILYK